MSGPPGKPRKQSKSSKEPQRIRPLFLLEDEPVRNYADDRLEVRQYVDVITSAVLGTPGPFTIGVYAKWGQGKTSVLRMAHQWLSDPENHAPHVVPVFFNAWLYEREQHPIIPLVAAIEKDVAARLELLESLGDEVSAASARVLRAAQRGARAFLYGLKLNVEGKLKVPFVGEVGFGVEHSAKNAADRDEALRAADKPDAEKRWEKWRAGSLYLSAFETLDAIAAVHRDKNDSPAQPIPRIAVFIDDLDRCLPENAFQLLEHIKLALGHAGFIFIFGLNNEVIDTHLVREAERRFGPDRAHLYERYLDKIVQLSLPLRSHREHLDQLMDGILARLKHALLPAEYKVFVDMKELLVLSSDATPRTLVRRVNALLVDARLRPVSNLPDDLSDKKDPRPHSMFLGVCLVERTLGDLLGSAIKRLRVADELCTDISQRGLSTVFAEFQNQSGSDARSSLNASESAELSGDLLGQGAGRETAYLLTELRKHVLLDKYFETVAARMWLFDRSIRDLLDGFVGKRPEGSTRESQAQSSTVGAGESKETTERWQTTEGQREIVERALAQANRLRTIARQQIPVADRTIELRLEFEPLTDIGLAILARDEFVLGKLRSLYLGGTQVTDLGLDYLAQGILGIAALSVHRTQISDAGLVSLTRGGKSVESLTSLDVRFTLISDRGLVVLSDPDTKMRKLSTLNLAHTGVTDDGVKALSRFDSGLPGLARLSLADSRITDSAVESMAHPNSGLRHLKTINLSRTNVTDAGLEVFGRPGWAKELESLDVSHTNVSATGAENLNRIRPQISIQL